ncbi:MAG: hypothetical protein M3067_07665 [Chloroflexota bacterium]|nr:hypothetical protein [Chloroflexota bacterium]
MISSRLAALRTVVAVALTGVLAVGVAACSGTSAPASAAVPSTVATNPPASASAAPTSEASLAVPSLPAGVGSAKWCLNTVEEVSAAIGTTVTAAMGSDATGAGGGCAYTNAAGAPIYAISVASPAPGGMFEGFKSGKIAEVLSGIADGAILVTPAGPLVLIKGQTVASLVILPNARMDNLANARAALLSLAQAAVGRM